jgi:hypothetical protein
MKLFSSRYFTLQCAVTLCILLLIIYILVINYYKNLPVDIEPSLLYLVAQPGTYTGVSTYGATELYPDGLRSEHTLSFVKINNGVSATNKIIAYNAKSNEIEYNAVRNIQIVYKPNHGKQLFNMTTSYINDKIVSSTYGYAIGKTDNSIKFHLSGSWHISNKDYHKIDNVMTRQDSKHINNVFIHPTLLGFNDFVMDEQYTME